MRSLTAEKLYQKTPGIQVRSAGTEPSVQVKVTVGDIGWADRIYAFEKRHLPELQERLAAKIKDAVGELAC